MHKAYFKTKMPGRTTMTLYLADSQDIGYQMFCVRDSLIISELREDYNVLLAIILYYTASTFFLLYKLPKNVQVAMRYHTS